jgi:hypothetical protein
MMPPEFSAPGRYLRVTRQVQRRKERMVELETVVDLKYVTTLETKSLSPMRVEEEMSTTTQGEVG